MDYVKFRARRSQTIKQNENTMTMHYILSEIAEKKEKNGQKRKKILATDWTEVEFAPNANCESTTWS